MRFNSCTCMAVTMGKCRKWSVIFINHHFLKTMGEGSTPYTNALFMFSFQLLLELTGGTLLFGWLLTVLGIPSVCLSALYLTVYSLKALRHLLSTYKRLILCPHLWNWQEQVQLYSYWMTIVCYTVWIFISL